jgi:hypothetical protein
MQQDQLCELFDKCSFFINEIRITSIALRFKERYCLSCKEACALYMVYSSMGQHYIPKDLYPNEYDRALNIMAKSPK